MDTRIDAVDAPMAPPPEFRINEPGDRLLLRATVAITADDMLGNRAAAIETAARQAADLVRAQMASLLVVDQRPDPEEEPGWPG